MVRPFARPLIAAVLATFACAAPAALDVAGFDRGIEACTDLYQHVNRKWLAAIERAGVKPLAPVMGRVAAVKIPADVARALGYLHTLGIGAGFGFGVQADAKDSSRCLVQLQQGGLGLPERDYYFKDDDRTRQQREAYLKHVARMLELAGEPAAEARKHAATIFAFESQLAKGSRTRVELRDDAKNYNKRTVKSLAVEAPEFAWGEYFRAIDGAGVAQVNLGQPEFFKVLARMSNERSASEWRAYMRWHVLKAAAGELPAPFYDESFDFNERVMQGRKAPPPRHRHVLASISGPYGAYPMAHAIGMVYVDAAFRPESKARALEKLAAMEIKIGYPDKWRDFSDARVGDATFVENWMRANQFDMRYDLRRQAGG